jgi:hypothetical protein
MLWSFVYAWIVVMKPDSTPARSSSTFTSGATQLVVHDAFETMCAAPGRSRVVDAEHDGDVRSVAGAEMTTFFAPRRGASARPSRSVKNPSTRARRRRRGRPTAARRVALGEHLHLLAAARDDPVPELDVARKGRDRVVLEE